MWLCCFGCGQFVFPLKLHRTCLCFQSGWTWLLSPYLTGSDPNVITLSTQCNNEWMWVHVCFIFVCFFFSFSIFYVRFWPSVSNVRKWTYIKIIVVVNVANEWVFGGDGAHAMLVWVRINLYRLIQSKCALVAQNHQKNVVVRRRAKWGKKSERERERQRCIQRTNSLWRIMHTRVREREWVRCKKRVNLNSSALVFSTCLSSLVSIRLPAVTHPLGKCFR